MRTIKKLSACPHDTLRTLAGSKVYIFVRSQAMRQRSHVCHIQPAIFAVSLKSIPKLFGLEKPRPPRAGAFFIQAAFSTADRPTPRLPKGCGSPIHSQKLALQRILLSPRPSRTSVTCVFGRISEGVCSHKLSAYLPGAAVSPRQTSVRRRRRRHIAQELIAAVTFDRGQVVRDQPARPFDCDLDTLL